MRAPSACMRRAPAVVLYAPRHVSSFHPVIGCARSSGESSERALSRQRRRRARLLCGRALLGPRLRLEAVALAGHRLDEMRVAPAVAELYAKLADVAVDDVALDLEVLTPDAVEDELAAQRLPGTGREEVEQGLLERAELELARPDLQFPLEEIDLDAVEADRRHEADRDPVGAAEERERSGHDLIECERDLEDVVDPPLEGGELHVRVALAGEREDRDLGLLAPTPKDVHEPLVMVDVEDGQVGLPFAEDPATVGQIGGVLRGVAAVTQGQVDEVAEGALHDEKDAGPITRWLGRRIPHDDITYSCSGSVMNDAHAETSSGHERMVQRGARGRSGRRDEAVALPGYGRDVARATPIVL